MESREKRKNIRVAFRTEIAVSASGKRLHLEGDSVNLSMGGMLARTDEKIPLETACRVELNLTGTQEPMGLTIEGRVIRHEPSGFVIHFEEMDLDSYTVLKEIVRYNAREPDTD
jgi:c-di-GMP-binding flagellar brake protein YcgR